MSSAEAYLPLLRMSIGLQKDGMKEPVAEMDPERKEWLKEAMANLLKNPVDDMKELLKKLETTEEASEKAEILDALVYYVEQIDLAKDFHKIGGLKQTVQLLEHDNPKVRAGAAHVIGSTVQNNPEPQKWAMELNALESLCTLLGREDASPLELNKAIFGISSMIRQNDLGTIKYIKELKGFGLLVNVLKREHDPKEEGVLAVRRRAVFLILYLASRAPAVLPATVGHVVPVITNVLDQHADDPDLRENAVLVLHTYQASERITLDKDSKALIVRSTKVALEHARKDEHDTIVLACEDLLKKVEKA